MWSISLISGGGLTCLKLCADLGEPTAEYGEALRAGALKLLLLIFPGFLKLVVHLLMSLSKQKLHPNIQIPKDFDGMLEADRLRTAAEASLAMPSPSPLPSASSSAGAVSSVDGEFASPMRVASTPGRQGDVSETKARRGTEAMNIGKSSV